MKNISWLNEISLSVILIVLVVLFLDPFMVLMPPSLAYILTALFLLSYVLFVGFLWREVAYDEREERNKMIAGRVGYLIGAGVLIVAIVWQIVTTHHPDVWLISALVGMLLGKLAGTFYANRWM